MLKTFVYTLIGASIVTVVCYSSMIYVAHEFYPLWGIFCGITYVCVFQFMTMLILVGEE